jgi:hypothetical protein
LGGAGLNPGNENGFFGMDAHYIVYYWGWIPAGTPAGKEGIPVSKTGWYPISVKVNTADVFMEAVDNDTIQAIRVTGDITIPEDCKINQLQVFGADVTVPSGVAMTVRIIDIVRYDGSLTVESGATMTANSITLRSDGSALTVDGTLNGSSEISEIFLYDHSVVMLNGTIIVGPDPQYFNSGIARVIPWTGNAWGLPYLSMSWGAWWGGSIQFTTGAAVYPSGQAAVYQPGQVQGDITVSAVNGIATISHIASNDDQAWVSISDGDATVDFSTRNNNQADYVLNITNSGTGTVSLFSRLTPLPVNQWTNPDGNTVRVLKLISRDKNVVLRNFEVSGPFEIEIVGTVTAGVGSAFYESDGNLIAEGDAIPAEHYAWDADGDAWVKK